MSSGLEEFEKVIRRQRTSYPGKYRGVVADTEDPENRGRLKLTVPSVLGEATTDWALPCVPYGGGQDMGMLFVPPVGAMVFVEFVEGDVSSPVWTGTYFAAQNAPAEFEGQATKLLKTEAGHSLMMRDTEGEEEITLRSAAGAEVRLDAEGTLTLTDTSGARIRLDAEAARLSIEDGNGNAVELSSSGISAEDASGNTIRTTASGIEIDGGQNVTILGTSVNLAASGGQELVLKSFIDFFNTHTHPTGVGPSGPPALPGMPFHHTTFTKAT